MAKDNTDGREIARGDGDTSRSPWHRRTVLKASGLAAAAGLGLGRVGTARSAKKPGSSGEGVYVEAGAQVASTPDDIQDAVDRLGSDGGTVKLEPGSYGDGDWTTGIELPDGLSKSTLIIDCQGASVDLSSWDGTAFFGKPEETSSGNVGTVVIKDLYVNCYGVPAGDLSTFVRLPDVTRSTLRYTAIGEFDIGTYIYASGTASSCHHNTTRIEHKLPDIGLKLGKKSASLGVDRGEYRMQVDRVGDAGCEVANGGWNELYIQTENARADVADGAVDGVRTLSAAASGGDGQGHDNIVKLLHRVTNADDAVSARIEGERNRVDAPGAGSNASIDKLAPMVPPADIDMAGWTATEASHLDMTIRFETATRGDGQAPTRNDWGQVLLDAGTGTGDTSQLSAAGEADLGRGAMAFARGNAPGSGGVLRVGWRETSDTYAAIERDVSTDSIRVDVVIDGASVSGFPVATDRGAGGRTDLYAWNGTDDDGDVRQFWGVNSEIVAATTADLEALGNSTVTPAVWATSDGTDTRFGLTRAGFGVRDNNANS
ncbi:MULTISPECIES: hypothetical protein [Haloarcula]|uniref:hypothetical protein n=1 Tax=Haloarcula TaxID=2237 RepID=UPI0023EAEBA3|nr:hypothetical protein [Halomicroarcula sp. XH51]